MAAELLALAILIAAAFFAPQMVFRMQDYFLCANTLLSKREAMDVEALSTTYERSLGKRMRNYSDGLGAGEIYYVTGQDFDNLEEISDSLPESMYENIVWLYVEAEVIPVEFYKSDYTINKWKRYVIYSEDYAKGVSFILWYFELQDRTGMVMKLLTDGEDGTFYALKTETNGLLEQNETLAEVYDKYNNAGTDLTWFLDDPNYLAQLWQEYAWYYEFMPGTELFTNSESVERAAAVYWDSEEIYDEYDGAEGRRMRFYLPFGTVPLEFLVDIGTADLGLRYVTYRYPDVTIGIRQIYERIPEFN